MPNAPLRTTGNSTRQAQYHADRILFLHALRWMRDRYGTSWAEVGDLPAGVYDRQYARREAKRAEQEVQQAYGRR